MVIRRLFVGLCSMLLLAAGAFAGQPPAAQSEFRPVNELPPMDKIPAAPLLVAAYAFVWVALMFYLWTIWRRLNKVEADMRALGRRSSR